MRTAEITRILEDAVSEHRLLTHPFYRRWEAGELSIGELASYAAQYRHFEAALPEVLVAASSQLPDGHARALVESNLADELAVPVAHLSLFDDFAAAVGASAADPTPATRALVDGYREMAVTRGAPAALAAVGAYEVQSADIAASKAEGLRLRYGITAAGTAFWDVHASMDAVHAGWTAEALAAVNAQPADVSAAARQAAEAWWSFLDERQAEATLPAPC